MRVRDIMTSNPACGSPQDSLESIARLMVKHDCGSVPVCESGRIIGVVTDRDIVVRAVAAGRNPLSLTAGDLMSHPVATIECDANLDVAIDLLEKNQVRRLPVVDHSGRLVGVVAQADVVRNTPPNQAGHLVQTVSQSINLGDL